MLKATVKDSINIQIAERLEMTIGSELSWILKSNVPDSILHQKSPGHIATFRKHGLTPQPGDSKNQLPGRIREGTIKQGNQQVRMWIVLFIVLSGILLIYTTVNLFRQQDKRKGKEKELAGGFEQDQRWGGVG